MLAWDEQLVHLAEARNGDRLGLLALTDSRLLYLFAGAYQDDLIEKRLDSLTDASVKGTLFKKRRSRRTPTASSNSAGSSRPARRADHPAAAGDRRPGRQPPRGACPRGV